MSGSDTEAGLGGTEDVFGTIHGDDGGRPSLWRRLRVYLLSGLLVLGPTALSLWVLVKVFYWIDGLLGNYLRLPWFDYHRIPGFGFIAMLVVLLVTGWLAHLLAGVTVMKAWDRALARLPLFRVIYNPAKQLGEALLSGKRTVFHQVVLVQWPHPGTWAIGFVTAKPPQALSEKVGAELVSVFVPSTPNPTTGFYHLISRERIVPVDLTVEQGIQMIVSGGVVRPPDSETPGGGGA
jgi:uncharacterized membrane protein